MKTEGESVSALVASVFSRNVRVDVESQGCELLTLWRESGR